jgi:hypothetical protein
VTTSRRVNRPASMRFPRRSMDDSRAADLAGQRKACPVSLDGRIGHSWSNIDSSVDHALSP